MDTPVRIRYFHHFRRLTYPGPWEDRLNALKRPDTEVEFVQPTDDAFIEFVEDVYQSELMGVQFAQDALVTAGDGGVDAICHSCGAEPGVRAARELCEVLVMGPACAAMHVASMLGRSFSYVIAGGDAEGIHSREVIRSAAEHYGLASKLASIRTVPASPLAFKEDIVTSTALERLRESVLQEARAAVLDDGADVIIGYGGPAMHDWLTEELHRLSVPVVSPDLALLAVTEMLVRLGLAQSKRTYPLPRRVYDVQINGAVTGHGRTNSGETNLRFKRRENRHD
jgi:Asp/Glu/hydantoin racemase